MPMRNFKKQNNEKVQFNFLNRKFCLFLCIPLNSLMNDMDSTTTPLCKGVGRKRRKWELPTQRGWKPMQEHNVLSTGIRSSKVIATHLRELAKQYMCNCDKSTIFKRLVSKLPDRQTLQSAPGWLRVYQIFAISLVLTHISPTLVLAVDPKFDPSTQMHLVLVPADAHVGSVIYRLRATDDDIDYPLTFEFSGDVSSSTVKIESLPCTKYNSVCQANVVLQRRLEPGRYYDFLVSVSDSKGGVATQMCSITATNFTTPHDIIFPHKPNIILIPEDAKRGLDLDYVIARKNPIFQKPVYLELWGSPLFAIRQKIVSTETTEGTVFLLGPLDFEKQAIYHLTILANDAYAEPAQDSRNIAGFELVVIVQDVQDQPPVFTHAPPVTKLSSGILPGDKILHVHAEDGDKGCPREVRYGLVSESNPFTSFFDINETSGEIFLMQPIEDIAAITHVGDPVLLTVIAEEVKIGRDEPPVMTSTVQVAFFLPERTNSPPYFDNDHYISRVDENVPQGTALTFFDPYVPRAYDDDTGKNGVFSLTLLNNNGTFEISPNVAERSATFLILVRDNLLLDYEERETVQFQILAQELGPASNLSSVVNVTIYLNDVNDNPPVFSQLMYTVELHENVTVGTKVVLVQAEDVDTGLGGRVRYTAILGYLNTSLNLDADTGLIRISTNNHGFDREVMPEFHLYVEARDNDGSGNRAQVPLIITLIDVNDKTPTFEKDVYEIILASDLQGFTTTAIVRAIDKDATAPNNDVRYEIINGNYNNNFFLDKETGELTVPDKVIFQNKEEHAASKNILILTIRAYDLGVPVKSSTATIRIYPPESRSRTATFVVPGHDPDKARTEETLSTITGGKVSIHDIRPLRPDETVFQSDTGITDIKNRSVVIASVLYDSLSVVDISEIQQRLSQHNSSYAIMPTNRPENSSTDTLYKAENKLLFWLLVLLATLAALTILILMLCCICSWCPLYGAASKRIVNTSRTEDDIHLVHREMANGKQTKSVQVAEWMGRREAWSADRQADSHTKPTHWEFHNAGKQFDESIGELHASEFGAVRGKSEEPMRNYSADKLQKGTNIITNLVKERDVYIEDINEERGMSNEDSTSFGPNKTRRLYRKPYDDEGSLRQQANEYSMRRHEIDRGSDIDYNPARRSLKRDFFFKDGNIEILQLKTKDITCEENTVMESEVNEDNIYANLAVNGANLSHPNLLMVDNTGKEILLRRFIEEQPNGKQIVREHYQIVPGAAYTQLMPNEIKTNLELKGDAFATGKAVNNSNVYSPAKSEVNVIHTQPAQGSPENLQLEDFPSQLHPDTSNQSLAHELESSLKRQNELLHQILIKRVKAENHYVQHEVAIETQSLPGQLVAIATQTECNAGTQTELDSMCEPILFKTLHAYTSKRRARSENDDSASEPDDCKYIRMTSSNISDRVLYCIQGKRPRRHNKYRNEGQPGIHAVVVKKVKRKIRTPIKEEGEEFLKRHKQLAQKKPPRCYKENITSVVKQRKNQVYNIDNNSSDRGKSLRPNVHGEFTDSVIERNNLQKSQKRRKLEKAGKMGYNFNTDDGYDYKPHESNECLDDSDAGEIVIKNSASSSPKLGNEIMSVYKSSDDLSKSFTEQKGRGPDARPRVLRNFIIRGSSESQRHGKNKKNCSQPSSSLVVTQNDIKANSQFKITRTEIEANCPTNGDLEVSDEKVITRPYPNSVPKYMEWYYGKNNKSPNGSSTKEPTSKPCLPTRQKAPVMHTSKIISKTRLNIKLADNSNYENETFKPVPALRKSPLKGNQLLQEDIVKTNKLKPHLEIQANHHPLVQHSAQWFERENVIPAQSTKLPHFMYPEAPTNLGVNQSQSQKDIKSKPSPIKKNEVQLSNLSKINLCIEDTSAIHPTTTTSNILVHKQLNAAALEDDHDSGIAMNSLINSMSRRNPIAEKKSVFSIAYDDVSRARKIISERESPTY